ncbi:MAG: hypothetical protein OHK0048_19000 [Rhodoferax sp.]
MSAWKALILGGWVSLLVACGGGGGGDSSGGGSVPPPAPTLVSIAVTPADSRIAYGTSQQLKATGTYSDGATADLSASVTWKAAGSSVVTLSAAGLATSKAVGTETITATLGSVAGSTTLTVYATFVRVVPGGYHTVALKSDGTLWAWGRNLFGQLGDGTTLDKASPVQIGTDKTWTQIAAGEFHTVALKSDGTLWAWGSNQFGQLGDGTLTHRIAPTKIGSAANWIAIAAGKSHTLAIKKDFTLWAWGNNTYGQLGTDPAAKVINDTIPAQVGVDKNYFSNWTQVSAGDKHTVARRADGTIWAWGDNSRGQLGLADLTDPALPAKAVTPTQVMPALADRWIAIAAGGEHTAAIRTDGRLFTWGANGYGQLGLVGRFGDVGLPTMVGDDDHWASVSAGGVFNLALKTDGSLWTWGGNNQGQLGNGTQIDLTVPTQLGTETTWVRVLAGSQHALAERADGTVWVWGRNQEGQQGNGHVTTAPVLTPTMLP